MHLLVAERERESENEKNNIKYEIMKIAMELKVARRNDVTLGTLSL